MELDQSDKSILGIIQKDSKTTIKEISARLNLTSTPIFERIKRMEKSGLIEGYSANLNREKLGLSLLVFCNISLNQHQSDFLEEFEREILEFPEVLSCFHMTGNYDYFLQVAVKDMSSYQNFVANKLASLKNIGKVYSQFVMTEIKQFQSYHLE